MDSEQRRHSVASKWAWGGFGRARYSTSLRTHTDFLTRLQARHLRSSQWITQRQLIVTRRWHDVDGIHSLELKLDSGAVKEWNIRPYLFISIFSAWYALWNVRYKHFGSSTTTTTKPPSWIRMRGSGVYFGSQVAAYAIAGARADCKYLWLERWFPTISAISCVYKNGEELVRCLGTGTKLMINLRLVPYLTSTTKTRILSTLGPDLSIRD